MAMRTRRKSRNGGGDGKHDNATQWEYIGVWTGGCGGGWVVRGGCVSSPMTSFFFMRRRLSLSDNHN